MRSKRAANRGGIVAAGHPETAQAGAAVLETGGNAVDAAIAAIFTACAAEPCLVALGAGGFMLIHDADTGDETLLDYFVSMPGRELDQLDRKLADLAPTPVDFGGTTQMFHSGHASNGVPGLVAGLYEAHSRFGTVPMRELLAPAIAVARKGVRVNAQQAYLFEILHGLLTLSPEGKRVFSDRPLQEGETFTYPELAGTLEALAEGGRELLYEGELAAAIVAESDEHGGRITAADLAGYEVVERTPVRADYRGRTIASNPPPSSGGSLIVHSLNLLSGYELDRLGWQSAEHLRHLIEVMAATNAVRKVRFDEHVQDEDVLEQLLAKEQLADDRSRLGKRLGPGNSSPNRLGNTTHLSVIDAAGNAVSTTNSNGANSGIQVPGTGIHLNSILGEEDLNPGGFHRHPVGTRIPSMMSPTLVLEEGSPVLALGSAGSNRIRSAVLQTISGVLDFGRPLPEAVEAPRVHVEGDTVEVEGGIPKKVVEKLAAAGYGLHQWDAKNLFFGGVNAVARDAQSGGLSGHGDSRRGGAVASA